MILSCKYTIYISNNYKNSTNILQSFFLLQNRYTFSLKPGLNHSLTFYNEHE